MAILASVLLLASSRGLESSIYHSAWFAALLALIAVNLSVAALRRWPWRPCDGGIVIVYLAVDLLLLGAILNTFWGVDGRIILTEGASTDRVTLDGLAIRVDDENSEAMRVGAQILLHSGGSLRVTEVLHSAISQIDVVDDGKTSPSPRRPESAAPALHYQIGNGQVQAQGWLVSRDHNLSEQMLGPLRLSLQEVDSLPDAPQKKGAFLELTFGKQRVELPLDGSSSLMDVPHIPWRVKILTRYERAQVGANNQLSERDSGPLNPAIRFDLLNRDGTSESHIAFARFPGFPTYLANGSHMAQGDAPSGVHVKYVEDGSGSGGPAVNVLLLASRGAKPERRVFVQISDKVTPIALDQNVALPWMGLQLRFDREVDHARVVTTCVPAPPGTAASVTPAARVTAGEEEAWISPGNDAVVAGHKISLQPNAMDLGFSVALKKFEAKMYPGTRNAAFYASTLAFTDGSTGTVGVNEPFTHEGFTFYQSGYDVQDGGPTSILRVTRDRGRYLQDAGAVLLSIGMICLLYGELRRRRIEDPSIGATSTRVTSIIVLVALTLFVQSAPSVAQGSPQFTQTTPGPHVVPPNPHGMGMPGNLHGMGMPDNPHGMGMPGNPHGMGMPGNPHGEPPVGQDLPDTAMPVSPLDFTAVRRLPVQGNGRVQPFDSYARELVMAVTGREEFEDHDPIDLVLSWITRGPNWTQRALIYVPDRALKSALDLDVGQTRFSLQLLASRQKLHELAQKGRQNYQEATPDERAAVNVLDRIGLLEAIFSGRLPAMIPPNSDADATWLAPADVGGSPEAGGPRMDADSIRLLTAFFRSYSEKNNVEFIRAATNLESAVRARSGQACPSTQVIGIELFYNRFHPFRVAWELYLGALVVLGLGVAWKARRLKAIALSVAAAGFIVHSAGFIMRMIFSHRPPVANMFESVAWVAWGSALFGLLFAWRYRSATIVVAAGIASALLLAVVDALPNTFDPSIQPLMPILLSGFWLTVHVLTITLGYAAFVVALALGHAWLLANFRGEDDMALDVLARILHAALRIGVVLVAVGALLGGVWAQSAWGFFWAWDPKEVWILIALLGYLIVIGGQSIGWWAERGQAVGAIVGFLGIAMSWYGVNYLLGRGLHVYGFGSGGVQWLIVYMALELLFLGVTTTPRTRPRPAGPQHRS